jgi:DNA-binding MarR family transcriptional regulator
MPRPQPAAAAMSKTDYEALAEFRYQLRRFLRLSEELAHGKGITMLQYLLMLQIKGFPGRDWATVGELSERLQAKQNGVVSLISRCEAAGLVRRAPSAQDRRRVEVHLTSKGSERLEQLALLHRDELAALRTQLSLPAK